MKRLTLLLPLLALAVLAGGCGTKTETSTAAVEVRRADPSDPYDPTGAKQPFDPIFLRSQFDVVCSDSILSAVVQSNDLGRVLDAAFGRTPSSKAESDELAVLYLRQHVECRLIRDSPLIIIDVSVERSVPDAKRIAPKLATDIAQAYQTHSRSLRDKAQQATADALRSEIESLEKAIEAGSPEQKAGLEFRRNILLEKLDSRFLAPYIDVRIVEAPVVPVGISAPATNAPATHAETAEGAKEHAP